MYKQLEKLQEYAQNFGMNQTNDESYSKEEIELLLCEQALNYSNDMNIEFDDIMGPSFGSDANENSIEVSNRGGLRHVSIVFDGDNFSTTQSEYSEIKNAIDELIRGESDESVDEAIDKIVKYGDKAIKVVFSFARKFNFNDEVQCNDLRILMKKLCLRSLEGRDTIIAVLIGANSKAHIKLAMLAAGEVREDNATKYICLKLQDKDLFDIAFDALLDIRDVSAVKSMLDVIVNTEKDDEYRISYLLKRTSYFIDFGNSIIKDMVECYNNSNPWIKPVLGNILGEYQEDIIPELSKVIDKETDNRKLESLYRLLGRLNNDKAAEILVKSYNSGKNMRACIIGLGQMRTPSAKKLFKDVLIEGNEEATILEEAVVSLSFMASKEEVQEAMDLIRPYTNSINDRLRIYSNAALARLGDEESLVIYMRSLTSSDSYTRNCATNLINRLRIQQITQILEKCLTLPENQVTLILTSLTKRKTFNKDAGNIMYKLLQTSSYLSKIEIYKIIGNTVNTKNEILPIDVLFDALDNVSNTSEKMVLEDIISRLRVNKGTIGTK